MLSSMIWKTAILAVVAGAASQPLYGVEPLLSNWDRAMQRLADYPVEIKGFYIRPTSGVNIDVPAGGGRDGIVRLDIHLAGGGVGYCSGTLLHTRRHILTAAHCFVDGSGNLRPITGVDVVFFLPGGQQTVAAQAINRQMAHPNYDGVWYHTPDFAVIPLSDHAPEGAETYEIFRATNEVGHVVDDDGEVGFGYTGVGQTGFASGTLGARRGSANRVDALAASLNGVIDDTVEILPAGEITTDLLLQDFDNGTSQNDACGDYLGIHNTSPGIGIPEVNPFEGDSGGPMLIGGKIAGVVSGGMTFDHPGNADVLPLLQGSFGELAMYTRSSTHQAWHDQRVPPVVTELAVGGNGTYVVPGGGGEQLRSLTFGEADRLTIDLSEDVVGNFTQPFSVQGLSQSYTMTRGVGPFPGTTRSITSFVDTSVHGSNFPIRHTDGQGKVRLCDKLTITINTNVTKPSGGLALDGHWVNPSSLTDTNGSEFPCGDADLVAEPMVIRVVVLPADLDRDNDVDLVDHSILLANFGISSGATYAQGDVDGDGAIGLLDWNILKANYGIDWKTW